MFHFNVDVSKHRTSVCNGSVIITLVNKDFAHKMSVSDVFLEAEFK